jgi:hypothetical protein
MHLLYGKSKRVIVSLLDSLVLGINNILNSLFGISYDYSFVFMNSSGDNENESSQRPSSITNSANESNPQPSENNDAESNSEGEAENSENDDILSDVSEDSGIGHLLPEADDLEVAERAANGDPDAINEIQEKYPAFFDHQSSTEKGIKEVIEYIEEEIRTDHQWGQGGPWTGGPSTQNDEQESSSPESSVTEAGPSGTSNEQSSGSNNPNDSLTGNGELNPSHKRARSESVSEEEGPENKKTKTKNNDDDDDSNNNPPKGGGSLGGGPSEGGNSPGEDSNLNDSSSNSVSKFEIVLVNIGFILEEIFKNMYPPF